MTETAKKYLTLVNRDHPIPEGFTDTLTLIPCLTAFRRLCRVERRTLRSFCALRAALRREGIVIGIDSAYRSAEQQRQICEEFSSRYGADYAAATVALPGTSEHHTGLAVDIVPRLGGRWAAENADMLRETEIFARIHALLPEYGLILRYPAGKEALTGVPYEPWHLRYVGKAAAKEMYENGICLEEYLQGGIS